MEHVEWEFDPYRAPAIPGTVLTIALTFVGIFGNVNIVWATLRKRRLTQPCNILICTNALSDVFHQLGHIPFAYGLLVGLPFLPLRTCVWIQAFSVFNMNFGAFSMLSLGLDRVYAVLRPLKYNSMNTRLYNLVVHIPPILYASALLILCFEGAKAYPDKIIICMIAEVYAEHTQHTWSLCCACLSLCIILSYMALWIVVFIKNVQSNIKLIKSLSVITMSVLLGWFLTAFSLAFASQDGVDPYLMYLVHMNVGWTVNMGITANYFIYFLFNEDYRKAFVEQLDLLTCKVFMLSKTFLPRTTMVTSSMVKSNSAF